MAVSGLKAARVGLGACDFGACCAWGVPPATTRLFAAAFARFVVATEHLFFATWHCWCTRTCSWRHVCKCCYILSTLQVWKSLVLSRRHFCCVCLTPLQSGIRILVPLRLWTVGIVHYDRLPLPLCFAMRRSLQIPTILRQSRLAFPDFEELLWFFKGFQPCFCKSFTKSIIKSSSDTWIACPCHLAVAKWNHLVEWASLRIPPLAHLATTLKASASYGSSLV